MIEAGKLRHRVVIQEQVETQDVSNGAINVSWRDVATVWAAIEPLSAREFVAAQAESSKVTTRITIRYRNNISAKMRLYHASKDAYYNIEGVLADKDSGLEYITLPCSEGLRYQNETEVPSIPVMLLPPFISGNTVIGSVLTADPGTWANDPDVYSYQWYINDLAVAGAVSNTFVIVGDVDDIVTVGVVAMNDGGASFEEFSDGVLIS